MEKKETEDKKEEKEETSEEKEKQIMVVKELPMQATNVGIKEDGEEVQFITIEDALTELLENSRLTVKAVA